MSLKDLSHPADTPEEATVPRKYFLSYTSVDRLERAAARARLSLSRTLDMLIVEGTRYLDEPAGEDLVTSAAPSPTTPLPSGATYDNTRNDEHLDIYDIEDADPDHTDFDPDVTEE